MRNCFSVYCPQYYPTTSSSTAIINIAVVLQQKLIQNTEPRNVPSSDVKRPYPGALIWAVLFNRLQRQCLFLIKPVVFWDVLDVNISGIMLFAVLRLCQSCLAQAKRGGMEWLFHDYKVIKMYFWKYFRWKLPNLWSADEAEWTWEPNTSSKDVTCAECLKSGSSFPDYTTRNNPKSTYSWI